MEVGRSNRVSLAGHERRDAEIVGGVDRQIREEHDVFHGVVHNLDRLLSVPRTFGGKWKSMASDETHSSDGQNFAPILNSLPVLTPPRFLESPMVVMAAAVLTTLRRIL